MSGITFSAGKTFSLGGKSMTIKTSTASPDSAVMLDTTVSPGMTNFHRALTVPDYTQVAALGISASKAVTVKINSSSSPDQTLTLNEGQGYVWTKDDANLATNPIPHNITDVYITNAGTADADVHMWFAIDQPGTGS